MFWTWVIGPLGALLAVPLSLLTRALLVEADPGARWALPLIAGKSDPTEPPPAPDKRESAEKSGVPGSAGMSSAWKREGTVALSGPNDARPQILRRPML